MSFHYLLAWVDLVALVTSASGIIILEKRDYHSAPFLFRSLLLLLAGTAICLAVNRMAVMASHQTSAFPLRVLYDSTISVVIVLRLLGESHRSAVSHR